MERECRLAVTDAPITRSTAVLDRWTEPRHADPAPTVYYVCGACGIVIGKTPQMEMAPGAVVFCRNCGAHNTLEAQTAG